MHTASRLPEGRFGKRPIERDLEPFTERYNPSEWPAGHPKGAAT
jgi:hypothetical protein